MTFLRNWENAWIMELWENCAQRRMGMKEKDEEKKPVPWEMTDPKPPVIRSGHFENRKQNR